MLTRYKKHAINFQCMKPSDNKYHFYTEKKRHENCWEHQSQSVAVTIQQVRLAFLRRIIIFTNVVMCCLGYRSNNFIVGLTNTDHNVFTPVLWDYTLCDQYPGTVPDGATVSVQCTHAYVSNLRFRYVIVQFPLVNDMMNFCEIEVFILGMTIIVNRNITCTCRVHKVKKNR